ncbi:MAG: hypothetical protein AB7V62_07410 [Thermoleophilia bacterium]
MAPNLPSIRRSRPTMRVATALAALLLGALAVPAVADVATPEYNDDLGDGGAAVDFASVGLTHIEADPGTAADDGLLIVSALDHPDLDGARFGDGDVVTWYLDVDGDAATGDSSTGGAERAVRLTGDTGAAPSLDLLQRTGASWTVVRALAPAEVTISEKTGPVLGAVAVRLPRADVGAPRGGSVGIVAASSRGADGDRVPDAGVLPRLAVPPTPVPPAVAPAAGAATAGETSLTFAAVVDPRGLPTTFRFDYGATSALGSQTAAGDAGSGTGGVAVASTVTGLAPGTAYRYRVVATNAAGTTYGPEQAATTVIPAPGAQTGSATVLGPVSARVEGEVSTRGQAGTAWVEWGTRAGALTRRTPARAVTGDRLTVQATLRGLAGETTYHYRVVVETPAGRAAGQTLALTTHPYPQILVDLSAPLGLMPDSRLYLRSLAATVRVVDPRTRLMVPAAAALRAARMEVRCTRGCTLAATLGLGRAAVPVRAIRGGPGAFRGVASASRGAPVTVRPRVRAGRLVTAPLLPLFTDGRGHQFLFRQGAEIVVRVSGPGLTPSATKIIVSSNARKLRCSVKGGRAVQCRPS